MRGRSAFDRGERTAGPRPSGSPSRSCRTTGQEATSFARSIGLVFSSRGAGKRGAVRQLRVPAAVWVSLWWVWMLLVGEWNHYEWIAATGAATVATTIGSLAWRAAAVRVRVPSAWLRRGWSALLVVFSDFAIVMWALVA